MPDIGTSQSTVVATCSCGWTSGATAFHWWAWKQAEEHLSAAEDE